MGILNKLTFKSMLHYKKRTFGTLLGVILSSALMFSFGLAFSSIRSNIINETINNVGNFHMRYEGIEYKNLDIFKKYDDINFIGITSVIGSFLEYEEHDIYSYVGGADKSFLKNIELVSGRIPEKDNEIIVPNNYYQYHKLKLSQTISLDLNINDEIITKQYTIVGVFVQKPALKNVVNDMYTNNVLYTFKSDYSPTDLVNFEIKFKKVNMGIYDIGNEIASSIGLERGYQSGTVRYKGVTINDIFLEMYLVTDTNYARIAILLFSLMVILTILMVVCMFVIFNGFAIAVNERKKMFGVLSSMGATGNQIFKSVFFESFIISVIGITLGFGLSVLLNYGIINYINNSIGDLLDFKIELSIFWLFIIVPLFFILATIFLSTLFPAMRAREVMPIEAIRQYDDYKLKRSIFKKSKLLYKLFGIEGELARKNIKRNSRKYRVTLISLVMCVILFVTFSTFLKFLLHVTNYKPPYDYDIAISISKKHEHYENIINDIKNIPIIDDIVITEGMIFPIDINFKDYYLEELKEEIDPDHERNQVYIITIDDDNYNSYLKKLKIKEKQPILLNLKKEPFNKTNKEDIYYFDPNTKIAFNLCTELPENDLEKISCTINFDNIEIVNVAPFGVPYVTFPTLILSNEQYRLLPKSPYPYFYDGVGVYINSKKHLEFDSYIDEIREKYNFEFGDFDYYNLASNPDLINTLRVLKTTRICLYLIISFIGIIGITSIYNTITTGLSLRKREFGVFRSVGLSPKGFSKIILYESILLSLKTLLYSVPLSIGIIYIIFKIMNFESSVINQDSYGFAEVIFPAEYFILSFVIVFIVVFVTMYFASKKIKNDNLADVLKENF